MRSSHNILNYMNESGNFGLPYELPTANDGGNSFNNLDELPWGVLLLRQEEDPGSRQAVRKEITRRCPEFETKLNEDQSNLIHLASEYGYVDIVKVLLFISTIKGRMSPCYIFDKDSKSPLDYAAMKGNKEVIYELLDALSLLAITSDKKKAFVEDAIYMALIGNQHQAFRVLAIEYMEMENWDREKVAIIKTTNKLLAETPRLSDDVHPEVYEALNKLFLSTLMITYCFRTEPLERFLGSDPLLFGALSSRSCPLQTQLNFCVLTRQTDDLLDEISKSRYALELAQGQDQENIFPMHNVSGWGLIHIVKLILIYESGSSSVCLLKNMDGNTPLHCAARTGEVGVINTLLSTCWECAGIVSDERNETALHCALTHKNAKAFKTLLEWYIIKEEFSHNTARDWECGDTSLDLLVDGYGKIVKELLCKKESMVCFQREFWEGKEYFVVIKFKNKGSTGTKYRDYIREVTSKITNRTIVSLSVDSRSIITLRVLIRSAMVRGILDVRDVDGNTVFDLLRNTIVRKTNVMGFVPYERFENVIWLLDAIQMGDYCVFSKIIVEDPEIRGYICELPLGGTPLHFSVRSGQLNDCTREIIRKMPHFAAWKDHKGRNPLHIASAKGYLEIVKELLTQYGFNQCFASTEADEDIYDEGQFQGTPLDHAIQRGQISVINELLSIWWKCAGVISRESDSALLRSALGSENFEAFKMLMERYIKDELLKAKEVDGNPMSDLADGYIDIVLKHLLNPKVDYSLSILLKNKDDGKKTCTKLPRPLYFAVIKVSSSSKRNDNNIVDELQLSAYYPKYFREVTIQNKMVLHLSIDDENSSVTLKLLLQSPLFYDSHVYGDDVFDGLYWAEVVENEMGTLLSLWSNKKSDACGSSSINVYDDTKEQLDGGVLADGNEEQLSVAAKEDYENVKADQRSDNGENNDEDISITDRHDEDCHTVRNQDRILLEIGKEFASFELCRDAIKDAAVSGKFEVKFTRLGRERIVADCSNTSTCKWKIRAKPKGSNYVVTEIEEKHTCLPSAETATLHNKVAKPKWVSSHITEKVRQDHSISTQDIIKFIKSKYQVDITCETARRAKKRALETINGTGPKENTIHGSPTESKKQRKISIASSFLSSNAQQSRPILRFLEQIPEPMHGYIHSTEDVEKDGHCGYRVIAMQLDYEVLHGWKRVRGELLNEIVKNEELYVKLMNNDTVANMRKAFAYYEDRATDSRYWLSLPNAGYVIANAYKAVVVSLSLKSGNLTFLPLLEPPPEERPHRIITFGFVNGNHFVSLKLKPDSPIPRVDRRWDSNVSKAAEVWKTPYLDSFVKFEHIMGFNSGQGGNTGYTASGSRTNSS